MKTTFTVNKPASLGGFKYGGMHHRDPNCYYGGCRPIDITILKILGTSDLNRKKTLYNGTDCFWKSGEHQVCLKNPILIRPEFEYVIKFKFKEIPSGVWFMRYKLRHEVYAQAGIKMRFYNDPIIGDAARGFISGLRLNAIRMNL